MKCRIKKPEKDNLYRIQQFTGSEEDLKKSIDFYEEGDTVYCSETNKLYIKKDNMFMEEEAPVANVGTLYDINKEIISQLPAPTKEDIEIAKDLVDTFIEEKSNQYYMLLCKEKSYYTLFSIEPPSLEPLSGILLDECIPNFGNLKCVNETDDKTALEFWVEIDGNIYVAYFFPYDGGVIKCCR